MRQFVTAYDLRVGDVLSYIHVDKGEISRREGKITGFRKEMPVVDGETRNPRGSALLVTPTFERGDLVCKEGTLYPFEYEGGDTSGLERLLLSHHVKREGDAVQTGGEITTAFYALAPKVITTTRYGRVVNVIANDEDPLDGESYASWEVLYHPLMSPHDGHVVYRRGSDHEAVLAARDLIRSTLRRIGFGDTRKIWQDPIYLKAMSDSHPDKEFAELIDIHERAMELAPIDSGIAICAFRDESGLLRKLLCNQE